MKLSGADIFVLVTDEFVGVMPLWGDTDSTEMNYMDTDLSQCQ